MLKELKLALDKASLRTYDGDGHLHVSKTPISKANVCPYLGREIPNAEALGLDPEKVYQLLRAPEELEKAAPSLNGKQLLFKHKPVSASEPAKELTVGSIGNSAVFEKPYLYNSLVVWDKEAVDGIKSDEQKELSAGYYYRADMTPGTYEGVPYDGVMRDLRFNHVALVVDGRAGSDVMVGDSALTLNKESQTMSNKKYLSPKAAMAKGALAVCLKPLLAQDAKIDLNPLLVGVTPSNWAAAKTRIAQAIGSKQNVKLFKDKLAQDSAVEEVVQLLNSLDKEDVGGNPDDDLSRDADADNLLDGVKPEDNMSKDSPNAAVMALVRANMSPEDADKIEQLLNAEGVIGDVDEPTPEAKDDLEVKDPSGDEVEILEKLLAKLKGGAMDDEIGKGAPLNIPAKPATGAAQKPEISKAAMDAAIADAVAKAINKAERNAVSRVHAIKEAERIVKPIIGNVIAQDSAEAVYKLALDHAGIDTTDVHPSAYKAMVSMLPKPGEQLNDGARKEKIALDGAAAKSFGELFPSAKPVRQL